MTANQIYKKIGGETPFNEWVGEQRKLYGEKFMESDDFLNMAGYDNNMNFNDTPNPTTEFVDDPSKMSKEQFVAENIDENIVYPSGIASETTSAETPETISATPTTQTAGFTANKLMYLIVGGVALYYGYKWMTKKK